MRSGAVVALAGYAEYVAMLAARAGAWQRRRWFQPAVYSCGLPPIRDHFHPKFGHGLDSDGGESRTSVVRSQRFGQSDSILAGFGNRHFASKLPSVSFPALQATRRARWYRDVGRVPS